MAVAFGLLATFLVLYFQRGFVPGDAFTYLAAGERLNAGHPLYALSPGDRPVDLKPPYWTVPLLSPPFIAVVWRPLALLPGDIGPYLWWIAAIAAIVSVLVAFARRRPVLTSVAIIALCVPLTYEIGVGNVNAFLLLGAVAVWRLTVAGRDRQAGAIVALLVALKLSPVVLGWWLVTQRRRVAVAAGVVAGLLLLALSLLGAGIGAHLDYLRVARDTASIGLSDLSLGGLAKAIGVSTAVANILPAAALVVGGVGTLLLRRRAGLAFACAVATLVLGSPVVNINSYALLLACIAPAVWPLVPESSGTPRPTATKAHGRQQQACDGWQDLGGPGPVRRGVGRQGLRRVMRVRRS